MNVLLNSSFYSKQYKFDISWFMYIRVFYKLPKEEFNEYGGVKINLSSLSYQSITANP